MSVPQKSALMQHFFLLKEKSQRLKAEAPGVRKDRLKKMRDWILANRSAIHEAMFIDFKKHSSEVDAIELLPVLSEIKNAVANLDEWMAPKRVDTPLTLMGTRSFIVCEPRGVCLIIAPWNYPFLLCAGPLVSALAAGNAAILKPSEVTPHVSAIVMKMAREVFDPSLVTCYEGGPEISQQLLQLPFDHIFFTGSQAVGKIVMRAAAENLTSVTLELGGKSPTIICKDAHVNDAARRTSVAKFVNNGQTCIAPDYILVAEEVAEEYIQRLVQETKNLFLEDHRSFDESPSYCRIANDHHFQRLDNVLKKAIDDGAIVRLGGTSDPSSRFIAPTILSNVSNTSSVMSEEIFGPVLPVLTFRRLEDAIAIVNERPKPLALYIFSQSKTVQERVIRETSSGGTCINDCGIHFFQFNLPFGGVNDSGLGKSHGYYGFLDFSHQKAVLKQRNGLTSVGLLYPPYTRQSKKILHWLFRFLGRS